MSTFSIASFLVMSASLSKRQIKNVKVPLQEMFNIDLFKIECNFSSKILLYFQYFMILDFVWHGNMT